MWNLLPDGPVANLFLPLDNRAASAARLVCRDWGRQVAGVWTRMRPAYVGDVETWCARLGRWPSLTTFTFRDCRPEVTDAVLKELHRLPMLTSLDLSWCPNVTDAGLAALHPLTRLTRLDLCHCESVGDAGAGALRPLTRLTFLSMRGCIRLGDAGVAALASLTGLEFLSLSTCRPVTDVGVAALRHLTGLTHLDLCYCTGVSTGAAVVALIPHLTSLTWLDLRHLDLFTEAEKEALHSFDIGTLLL